MRPRRLSVGLTALAAFSALAGAARAGEWTFPLPADLPSSYWLCDIKAISPDTREIIGIALYEGHPRPLADGTPLPLTPVEFGWAARVETRAGVRTVVVDGSFDNYFRAEIGFCGAPPDPGGAQIGYTKLEGFFIGGSPAEEKLDGIYEGHANIWVDFCDAGDPFGTAQRIEEAFRQAGEIAPDIHLNQRSFDTTDGVNHASVVFDLAGHTQSVRLLMDRVRPLLEQIGTFDFTVGNRVLVASNCTAAALWVRVADADGRTLWAESFAGWRILAMRQPAGNIFIVYLAGVDSVVLNLAGVPNPGSGRMTIAPALVEDDRRPPDTITYGLAVYGETQATAIIAASVDGTVFLTTDPMLTQTGLSGWFSYAGRDVATGALREVTGGFRNLVVR